MLQILILSDTKFPVWYPYYCTWFIAVLMEFTLLLMSSLYKRPETAFDFLLVVIQSLRIVAFIVLPSLYFGLRNGIKVYDSDDAERQSLLAKKLAPNQSNLENGNGYGGTTDDSTQQSETADDASDAGSEDSWLGEQRKAQELIAKRLENDGNWWTYAKGFSVSSRLSK